MKLKKVEVDGFELRKIGQALIEADNKILDISVETWGDRPTKKRVTVDLNQLLGSLVRILEKYTDRAEDLGFIQGISRQRDRSVTDGTFGLDRKRKRRLELCFMADLFRHVIKDNTHFPTGKH